MPLALRYLNRKSASSPSSSPSQSTLPRTDAETRVTTSRATRLVIPALAPSSLNFTGTARPMRNRELPSERIGLRKNVPSAGAWYWTHTVKLIALALPAASDAEQVTVVLPGANVVPDAGAQVTGTGPSTSSI